MEDELGVVGEGLGEGKEEEDGRFMLLGIFEARNTRPGECGSPGQADPHLKSFASVKTKSYLILKILYDKSQRSEYG